MSKKVCSERAIWVNLGAWDLTTHLLPEAPPGGRPKCSTQDILNGIFSIVHGWRGGCSRIDFPPWQIVYHDF